MALLETIDVILGAKTDKLDAGLASGKRSVNSFVGQLKSAAADTSVGRSIGGVFETLGALGPAGLAAGALVGGGLAVITAGGIAAGIAVRGINQQLSEIDSIGDSAKRIGVSFNELTEARLALGRSSGLDDSTIDASLQKMQLNLREAQSGTGDLANTLSALGLDAGELLKAGPVEAIKQVSEAAQQMKNPIDQSKLAFDLFGKAGVGLVTALRDGPDAIEEMQNKAKALGLELSQAQVEQVGAANDAWEDMTLIATGAFRQIAAEVAPVMTVIFSSVTDIATEFGGWTAFIRPVVDNTVWFAGSLYDAYEWATLTHKTLYNIATLNFSQVGEDIKAAASFDTGDKLLAKVNEARRAAEESAKKPPGGDLDLTAIEAEKKAKQDALDLDTKTQEKVRDKLDSMREEIELLGKTREEIERIKLAKMGANEAQLAEFDVLLAERKMREAETIKPDLMSGRDRPRVEMLQKGSVEAFRQANANDRNISLQQKANTLLEGINTTLIAIHNAPPAQNNLKRI